MKFNLSDPNFVLLLVGLFFIVGCVFSYGYGFNLTEGFQESMSESTPTPGQEEPSDIIITSPQIEEETPQTSNSNPQEVPNMQSNTMQSNVQEVPNMQPNTMQPNINSNNNANTQEISNVQVPSLHTPTPESIKLINNSLRPMGSSEVTESRHMTDQDYEAAPDDNAKSNSSNEKMPWARHKGIHHGRDLDLTPRIPNISQIGGEGPSNYFHPNIVISRGNNDDSKQTHRLELGLGPEIMNMVNQFSTSMYGQGNMMNQIQNQIDNSGFNLGFGDNSGHSLDDMTWDNKTWDTRNNTVWDENEMEENHYDPENDFFNTAKTNIHLSKNQELKQKGESKLCHEGPNKNRELFKNSFEHKPEMKEYHSGYQYQNPNGWNVPQKRPPVCLGCKNKCLPSGVFDRGTPTQALELTNDTQVGSIMPKFTYTEQPRS